MSSYLFQALKAAEMFPDIPFEAVQKIADANKGNLESISEELLSYDILRESESKSQQDAESVISSVKTKKSVTAKPSSEITIMSTLLGCSVDTISQIHQRTKNSHRTVREVIESGWNPTEVEIATIYNRQMMEIADAKKSNFLLQNIENKFYVNSLHYFKGDVNKTLKLATWMVDPNLVNRSKTSTIPKPAAKIVSSDPMADLIQHSLKTNKLDLHGLTVPEARTCVQQTLVKWWNSETEQRIMEGLNLRGSRAMYVCPLEIITGRGLHSSGGKPKLKILVHGILKSNNYLFEDITLGYLVTGKKN
ncbi:hypothetical protein OGAPHI_002270 [Ogataea philodendri]|uniref:Smr domain-containing protein n=1 Tax=Ogataea philodendri TaxID=1378263 RepID=A0A9P8PB52_9ASCO|nr:uncharacterized protein OGAPHI_002270 [Ogataea philodendri]KAH3668516.1 hypothetical protein OGAPHI_002270 [Ogataea philodendri]